MNRLKPEMAQNNRLIKPITMMKIVFSIVIAVINFNMLFDYLTGLVKMGYDIHGPSIGMLPLIAFLWTVMNCTLFFLLQKRLYIWELLNILFVAILLSYFLSPIWRFEMFNYLLLLIFSLTLAPKYLWIGVKICVDIFTMLAKKLKLRIQS